MDRELADDACEGAAMAVLDAAGLAGADRIDLRSVAERAHIALDPNAPPGCHGAADPARGVVRLSLRGTVAEIFATLGHELGHLALFSVTRPALEFQGERVDREHGEGDATRVGQALAFPRRAVREVLSRYGFDVARVGAICPLVPVRWAILRAAWVAGRAVVFESARGRRVAWAPDGVLAPEWQAWTETEMAGIGAVRGVERVDVDGRVARAVYVLP